MENFDEINKKRRELVDTESTGYAAAQHYYKKRAGNVEGAKTRKKNKSTAINVRINITDLNEFDFLSGLLNEPRASMISEIISYNIEVMFHALEETERTHFAELVDNEMVRLNLEHEFKGKTWFWEVAQPNQEAYNPENQKNWDLMKANLRK